jgi:hypothetical protein
MTKSRTGSALVTLLMLAAIGVTGAIVSPTVWAAETPEWWVNGSLLKGSEELAEETSVTTPFEIEAHGEKIGKFIIRCEELKIKNGVIEGSNIRREESVVFGKCGVVGESSCKVAIKTKPLVAKLEGSPGAIKLKFVPKSGAEIANWTITGCTAHTERNGNYEADGTMICNYKGVETESEEHPLEFTASSGSKVEVNGISSEFTGTDKVHLADRKLWSARG